MKKVLAIVLALMLTLAFVSCGEKEDINAKSEGSMTYAEYEAAAVDSAVVVEGYVQAKRSWREDKVTFFMQDGQGAYFVYDAACSQADYDKLTEGCKVKVTGVKTAWEGEVEVIEGKIEFLDGKYVAEPTDVTSILANEEELIKKQNSFASFKGMTVAASTDADGNEVAFLYNWNGSGAEGDDIYFKVSLNDATYTFTIESYLTDKTTDVYKAAQALKVGDKIDMEGFIYWYQGIQPHITSITAAK